MEYLDFHLYICWDLNFVPVMEGSYQESAEPLDNTKARTSSE
jgi:hypothetical protein